MKKIIRRSLIVLLISAMLTGGFLTLLKFRIIRINHPDGLKGVDVSCYQGEIDWHTLSEGLDFAFIKATEGSAHQDEMFSRNWEDSHKTGLFVGAYHFFSYDSPGASQAENFIATVGDQLPMLPPVIDVELYDGYMDSPKAADEVIPELEDMISALEEKYGAKPIIYCSSGTIKLYGKAFADCPVWIRSVYYPPFGVEWSFWQYCDTEKRQGYKGEEPCIDMNVFKGSRSDLSKMLINKS